MVTNELEDKMRVLNRLSDSIDRARRTFVNDPNYKNALAIQHLERQRKDIRRTLPKLKEVL